MEPTPSPASAPVVAALEAMWETMRDRHSDVPAAVLVLGSGTIGMRPGEVKLGHFASTRWRLAEASDAAGVLPEVFVGGEGLVDGAAAVLGTLLHEAAHAIAHTRRIQDTSRQGRYHNRRYAALAAEMGEWQVTWRPSPAAAPHPGQAHEGKSPAFSACHITSTTALNTSPAITSTNTRLPPHITLTRH
jgi:hypothetical protein